MSLFWFCRGIRVQFSGCHGIILLRERRQVLRSRVGMVIVPGNRASDWCPDSVGRGSSSGPTMINPGISALGFFSCRRNCRNNMIIVANEGHLFYHTVFIISSHSELFYLTLLKGPDKFIIKKGLSSLHHTVWTHTGTGLV